jgi:hypothetical protein
MCHITWRIFTDTGYTGISVASPKFSKSDCAGGFEAQAVEKYNYPAYEVLSHSIDPPYYQSDMMQLVF